MIIALKSRAIQPTRSYSNAAAVNNYKGFERAKPAKRRPARYAPLYTPPPLRKFSCQLANTLFSTENILAIGKHRSKYFVNLKEGMSLREKSILRGSKFKIPDISIVLKYRR